MIDSLRLRLLWWLLIPMAVYVGLSTSDAYDNAVSSATLVQDRALLASARMMAGQVGWNDGAPVVSVPPAALELFASPAQDAVYYQVLMDDDTLLAGRPDFPAQPDFAALYPVYTTTSFEGRPLRVVSYIRALFDEGTLRMVAVSVGQTMQGRQQMIDDQWHASLRRQIVLLLLAISLVVLGLTMELRPILALKDALATRQPDSLTPLQAGGLQQELRPIVEAINQYIFRLNAQVTVQKRFVADAAHQLRTPLAVIDSQIQFARQLDDPQRVAQVLASLQEGSRSMTDLTNKLLLLSQAEASNGSAFPRGPVDLLGGGNGAGRTGRAGPEEEHRPRPGDHPGNCHGHRQRSPAGRHADESDRQCPALHPEGGKVTVGLENRRKQVIVTVTDNGPGIPAEVRERVFERFYRNARPDQPGSGLGLAIVREIVQASQGSIRLKCRPAAPVWWWWSACQPWLHRPLS
jgi:two-component system sensor histidine kinase TctE